MGSHKEGPERASNVRHKQSLKRQGQNEETDRRVARSPGMEKLLGGRDVQLWPVERDTFETVRDFGSVS